MIELTKIQNQNNKLTAKVITIDYNLNFLVVQGKTFKTSRLIRINN